MKKILIVDDDAMLRDLFQMTLELEGYQVDTAINGHHAQQRLFEESWDLLVLDLSMPVMDGITLLHALKIKEVGTPMVMILSGMADYAKVKELKALGAKDVLQKPVQMSVLIERIQRLL